MLNMKNKKKLRIVFLGTPTFAVTVLDALLQNDFNVVGVVTNVDKKSGRGMKLQASAVKEFALKNNIPVLQPPNLKSTEFLDELKSFKADIQVVVAFRMLPQLVWAMPPLGTINIHASLLPDYRGAAPINWAIINGETKTGVTTFQLKQKIDTGDILLKKEIKISDNETAGSLHDRLALLGGNLICETLDCLLAENLDPTEQTFSTKDKVAPKIFKEDCEIDWSNNARVIHNLIRGLSPYPAAYTILHDKKLKVFDSFYKIEAHTHKAGSIETDNKTFLRIACNDGWIYIRTLQLAGKKKMHVEDFLRGFTV